MIRRQSGSGLPLGFFVMGSVGAMGGFAAHEGDYVTAAAIGLTVVGGLWGYYAGGVRLLGGLVAFLFAFQFTTTVARWLAPHVVQNFSLAPGTTWLVSLLTAAGSILAAVWLVVEVVSRWVTREHPRLATGNQLLGFGIGSAEGGLFTLILLGGIVSVAPLAEQASQVAVDANAQEASGHLVEIALLTKHSALGPLVETYNPFENMPPLRQMQRTVSVIQDPQKLAGLAQHPAMMKLYEKPSVRAAMESLADDDNLQQLVAAGKSMDGKTAMALLNNPSIVKLLEQPELVNDIAAALAEMDMPLPSHAASLLPAGLDQ